MRKTLLLGQVINPPHDESPYTYHNYSITNAEFCQVYKWDDGRLEIFIRGVKNSYQKRIPDSHLYQGWTGYITFPVPFIKQPVGVIGFQDTDNGVIWGAIFSVSKTDMQGIGISTEQGSGRPYFKITGRWK